MAPDTHGSTERGSTPATAASPGGVVMILAAADPELHTHYSASAYGLGIIRFLILAAALLFVVGVIWNWIVGRVIARAVHDALNNGDQRTLHAVTEQEHAHRERVTVPRRLTDRSHR